MAKKWGWGEAPALGRFKFPASAKGVDAVDLLSSLSRCEAKGKGGEDLRAISHLTLKMRSDYYNWLQRE